MTKSVLHRLRRAAVALLALACLSPSASFALPDVPPLPVLLGLVPNPVPTAAAPAPVLTPMGVGFEVPANGAAGTAAARGAQGPPGQSAGGAPKPPQVAAPPSPPAGAVQQGSALPLLPPDQTPRGRYHRVEPGETAASIAGAYGLRSQWPVYDANPVITDPKQPPVGAWLYIPHPSTAPAPRPRPGQSGWSPTPTGTAIVDGIWLELAACESSGNWSADTGNGYYGGLQFTVDSWRMVGGAGYPHDAHPMEQIARADYLQRIQGWKAWPLCAEKLGLIPVGEGQAEVERARSGRDAHE